MPDLTCREVIIFLPLVLAVLWIGVYPSPVLNVLHAPVAHLLQQATLIPNAVR